MYRELEAKIAYRGISEKADGGRNPYELQHAALENGRKVKIYAG